MHPYGSSAYRSAPSASEVSARRYRYTGKERDEETGLDYFGARYYAPWLGRWTTADPLGLQAGLNLYLYGRASPVVMVDPNGMQEVNATLEQKLASTARAIQLRAAEKLAPGAGAQVAGAAVSEASGAVRIRPKGSEQGVPILAAIFPSLARGVNPSGGADHPTVELLRQHTWGGGTALASQRDVAGIGAGIVGTGTAVAAPTIVAGRPDLSLDAAAVVAARYPEIAEALHFGNASTPEGTDEAIGGGQLLIAIARARRGVVDPELGNSSLKNPDPRIKINLAPDAPKRPTGGPYSNLKEHRAVGPGKEYTPAQKRKILEANEARGGGTLYDDVTGEPLVRPEQHESGVTPPRNEAHVDHLDPKSLGGPNSFENARLRAREANLKKGAKRE